jgi:hypothetical protein
MEGGTGKETGKEEKKQSIPGDKRAPACLHWETESGTPKGR